MNEKALTEQSSTTSSAPQPVDKKSLFARLLGVQYPMAPEAPETTEILLAKREGEPAPSKAPSSAL